MPKQIAFTTHGLHRIYQRGLLASEAKKLIESGLKLTPTKHMNGSMIRPIINEGWKFIVQEFPDKIVLITLYKE